MEKSYAKLSLSSINYKLQDGGDDETMVIITTTTMIIGRLSNNDVEGNDNVNGSRFLWYISLPSSHDYNMKLPISSFSFSGGRDYKTTVFLFFS